ncbi:RNA polymerase subunit sigma-24, partial [Burkholderia multivorans]
MDEDLVRELVPAVIGILRGRGVDFSDAEDAVQEALIAAVRTWPGSPPRDPQAWLVTVAWRRHVDRVRTEAARTEREAAVV